MEGLLTLALAALGLAVTVLVAVQQRRASRSELERIARERGLVYVAVRRELAEAVQEWSPPVRIRFQPGSSPVVWDMEVDKVGSAGVEDRVGDDARVA